MKYLILLFIAIVSSKVNAQQLFFNNFDSIDEFNVIGSGHSFIVSPGQNLNTWVTNDSYVGGTVTTGAGSLTIDDTPSQVGSGVSIPDGKYKHINNIVAASQGIQNANMLIEVTGVLNFQSDFIAMNSSVNTTGLEDVSFNFYWVGDAGRGFLYYSIDDGNSWTVYKNNSNDTVVYSEFTDWSLETVKNDIFNDQATLKFGFLFDNSQNGNDNEPAFSIDDVFIANAPIAYSNAILTTYDSAVSYVWIDCATGLQVGTNSNTFTPVNSGEYKVELTFEGGTVASKCLDIVISEINNLSNIKTAFAPNPVTERAILSFGKALNIVEFSISNTIGVVLQKGIEHNISELEINVENFQSGVYFINIVIGKENKVIKFSVQK